MIKILKVIADAMDEMGITYAFERFDGIPTYPYFVGEYTETENFSEDGRREVSFTVTGTTRHSWLELEQYRQEIEKFFNPVSGYRPPEGGIAIFYASALPVPTDDAELKRLEITLNVKEWRVV